MDDYRQQAQGCEARETEREGYPNGGVEGRTGSGEVPVVLLSLRNGGMGWEGRRLWSFLHSSLLEVRFASRALESNESDSHSKCYSVMWINSFFLSFSIILPLYSLSLTPVKLAHAQYGYKELKI